MTVCPDAGDCASAAEWPVEFGVPDPHDALRRFLVRMIAIGALTALAVIELLVFS